MKAKRLPMKLSLYKHQSTYLVCLLFAVSISAQQTEMDINLVSDYNKAVQLNQRALALDPSLIAAHYNNACANALAKKSNEAFHHLNLLADALTRFGTRRKQYYSRLMKTDPDLVSIRKLTTFKQVSQNFEILTTFNDCVVQ